MSFQLQTPEEATAATADIVKLEAAVGAAKAALREHDAGQNPKYPSMDANARRTQLQGAVATTQRALVAAQNIQHNAALYADILDGTQKNMARNAAEKAAQQAQAANASEAQFKVRAESAYVAAGGTALGFISEWPGLRAELVRQKTLAVLGAQPTNLVDEYITKRNGG